MRVGVHPLAKVNRNTLSGKKRKLEAADRAMSPP